MRSESCSAVESPSSPSAYSPLADLSGMPQRFADFACLAEALDYAALTVRGMDFHNARGKCVESWTYADIRAKALDLAPRLLGLGLKRHARIGVIAEMGSEFITLFFACQYAGLLAVPLPVVTGLGGREGYEDQLARVLTASKIEAAFGPETSQDSLVRASSLVTLRMIGTMADLEALPAVATTLTALGAGEPSHIQFSSGSTHTPKGVLIGQDALMANARAIVIDGLELKPTDRAASWLPFYHDMGLIGCVIAPVAGQMHIDYLHTDDFAKRPLQWLQMMSDKRSTISFSPTFGYDICADRMRGNNLDLDLSAWRIAGIGGEMVKPETMLKFVEVFAPYGFAKEALLPSYGMAEATLAVTFTKVGRGMKVDHIEKSALLVGHAKQAIANGITRGFASCGVPLGDTRIEVRDEHGHVLPDRRVGIIHMHGSSVMDGYDLNDEANRRVFDKNRWLDTGDMGYLADGELYLTGRKKDMMIVNGRNLWPQDLEWQVEQQVEGLRRRDTAAFAVEDEEGRELPVILVQCRSHDAQVREELKSRVHSLLVRHSGVQCHVELIPPKSLPFTTSGKLSRARAREAYLAGEYRSADAIPA